MSPGGNRHDRPAPVVAGLVQLNIALCAIFVPTQPRNGCEHNEQEYDQVPTWCGFSGLASAVEQRPALASAF
jgi:hypothetical protein